MALVNVVSFGIRDGSGKRKSMALYVPQTNTIAEVQTEINSFAPLLDAVIDGKIEDVSLTFAMTLPGGLKAEAEGAGNRVREGALLTFDAANTNYAYSLYVPSVKEALFTEDTFSLTAQTAAGNALVAEIVTGGDAHFTNQNADDLTAYTTGERTFRK